jgi:co-chaperonin GroES (HSP10)
LTVVVVRKFSTKTKQLPGLDLSGIVDANEKQREGQGSFSGRTMSKISDGSFTLKEGDEVIFRQI